MEKLPLYELVISEEDADDSGVDFIALVDEPAIERNFQAFNSSKDLFKIRNEEKRIISGALMVANLPIYRRDEMRGEYFVKFSKKTIEQIVQKFFRNKFTGNVNLDHDHERVVDGVYMFESFLVDNARGISAPSGFDRLTDGSWFGSFKVDNTEIWDKFVKTGEFKGFSVEGFFEHVFIEDKEETVIDRIIEAVQQLSRG